MRKMATMRITIAMVMIATTMLSLGIALLHDWSFRVVAAVLACAFASANAASART